MIDDFIADTNNIITKIVEENNYYPFGLKHNGYNGNINGVDHKYGFGGKEEQDELGLGWIDITARNYDPALGRWMNLDPLAEDYESNSPYNFVGNSPIFFSDPTGLFWIPSIDDDGNITYTAEEGDSATTLAEQYSNINQEQAEQLTGTTGDTVVYSENSDENTVISGGQVSEITSDGSDVLKYDLGSKQDTDQRFFDHFLFARDVSSVEGKSFFNSADYFKISQLQFEKKGTATVDGIEIGYKIWVSQATSIFDSKTISKLGNGVGIPVETESSKNVHGKIGVGGSYRAVNGNMNYMMSNSYYRVYMNPEDYKNITKRLNKTFPTAVRIKKQKLKD